MTYSISEFAALTGVSERTLRYYHQRGLLKPAVGENGYRQFSSDDADRMQLIQFYTAAGFTLTAVTKLLQQTSEERLNALRQQRKRLLAQQIQLQRLIAQVDSTIVNQEDDTMTDTEKFAAFKQAAIQQNDAQFGETVVDRWGQQAKATADQHFAGLDEATYNRSQTIEQQLAKVLRQAVQTGAEPTSDAGHKAYDLHREWLTIMWPTYSAEMHVNLMLTYEADDRFGAYYDKLAGDGASAFLIAAVRHFAR